MLSGACLNATSECFLNFVVNIQGAIIFKLPLHLSQSWTMMEHISNFNSSLLTSL